MSVLLTDEEVDQMAYGKLSREMFSKVLDLNYAHKTLLQGIKDASRQPTPELAMAHLLRVLAEMQVTP